MREGRVCLCVACFRPRPLTTTFPPRLYPQTTSPITPSPGRSAFFNPRLYTTGTPFCVSGERADELVRAGVTMVDSGNKKGGADVRLKDAMLKAGEDFERYGLRLGAVVLISSDSDFVADLASAFDAGWEGEEEQRPGAPG